MSYNWYWKCNECIPTDEAFLNAIWNGDVTNIKNLEEAFPYYHLETLSNRQYEGRRCKNCNQWHTISTCSCKKYEPFEIPKCQIHKSIGKELFFLEKNGNAVVFIKRAFCKKEKPPYLESDQVYDPYFYIGKRYEKNDFKGSIILSAVYFNGKNGKSYGNYSPYFYSNPKFYFDELDVLIEWLQNNLQLNYYRLEGGRFVGSSI